MDDLIKIPFKRSILVPEIQSKLNDMDVEIRNYDGQYYLHKKLLDNYEDTKRLPSYVKDYVKSNYTDKIILIDAEDISWMFEVPSITKSIDYTKERSGIYGLKAFSELFKFSEINKRYVTKITGAHKFDDESIYENCEWFITEYYVYMKFNKTDSYKETYILKSGENDNVIIPDFGNENIDIEVLREDLLDTPETREILLNLI